MPYLSVASLSLERNGQHWHGKITNPCDEVTTLEVDWSCNVSTCQICQICQQCLKRNSNCHLGIFRSSLGQRPRLTLDFAFTSAGASFLGKVMESVIAAMACQNTPASRLYPRGPERREGHDAELFLGVKTVKSVSRANNYSWKCSWFHELLRFDIFNLKIHAHQSHSDKQLPWRWRTWDSTWVIGYVPFSNHWKWWKCSKISKIPPVLP